MSEDLSAAPPAGATEAVQPADASASSAPAESTAKAPSTRDAIKAAWDKVEKASANPPNETDRARAVLKDGAGADDRASAAHEKGVKEAVAEATAATDASERAKKGWETRRENQARADTIEKAAKETAKAVTEATKPEAKPEPAKAADTKHPAAPKRFAKEALPEWDNTPEPVRAEIHRAIDELEQGHGKYKEDAQRYSELQEFEALSQEYYKQPLRETLKNYADLDRMLHSDPLAAFERLASSMTYKDENGKTQNWTLKQLARHILDQDGVETFNNPTNDLQREIADLKRQLGDVTRGLTERQKQEAETRTKSVEQQIADFAKDNKRFDELLADIEMELSNPKFHAGLEPIARLQKAYEKAERLNPAPSLSPPAPEIPAPDPAAQTRKGQTSISGSPSAGSNPAAKKPVPPTSRDALKAAFEAKGLALS